MERLSWPLAFLTKNYNFGFSHYPCSGCKFFIFRLFALLKGNSQNKYFLNLVFSLETFCILWISKPRVFANNLKKIFEPKSKNQEVSIPLTLGSYLFQF